MLYNYYGDTFKIELQSDGSYKVFCKARSRWSTGWTYVGKEKTEERASNIAKRSAS